MDLTKLRRQGTYTLAILAAVWLATSPIFLWVNDNRYVDDFGRSDYQPWVSVYSLFTHDGIAEAFQTMLLVSITVLPFWAALKKVWFDHRGGRPELSMHGRAIKWGIIVSGVVIPAILLSALTPWSNELGNHGLLGGIEDFALWSYYVYNGIAIGLACVASYYAMRVENGHNPFPFDIGTTHVDGDPLGYMSRISGHPEHKLADMKSTRRLLAATGTDDNVTAFQHLGRGSSLS